MTCKLLSRAEFRRQVFARDNERCVICGRPGEDAHHLMERRLWPDGGYYVDNGVTVCGDCHRKAEATVLPCFMLREAAGIVVVLLPPQLDPNKLYDKWGNEILRDGSRLPGELFERDSVQKVLAPLLDLFKRET